MAQPALWATTVALAALWRSHGVTPGAVVGSSAGEITAATVAGALSLDDGARAVALFSRAQTPLLGRGAMLSVLASADEVRPRLARYADELELTARYAPRSVVVSGTPEAVAELAAELAAESVRTWRIALGLAGHSRQIDPVLDALRADLAFLRPRPTDVAYYSAAAGTRVDPLSLTADYWCAAMRRPVDFEGRSARCSPRTRRRGRGQPAPVLAHTVRETADHAGVDAVVTGTLRRYRGGQDSLYRALGELYAHGVEPEWNAVFEGRGARRCRCPPTRSTPPPTTAPAPKTPGRHGEPRRRSLPAPAVRAAGRGRSGGAARGTDGPGPRERRRRTRPRRHGPGRRGSPLSDLGLDSAGATELRALINAATGLELPVTLVFDHPTAPALVDHLDRVITGRSRVPVRRRAVPRATSRSPSWRWAAACPAAYEARGTVGDAGVRRRGPDPFPADRGWRPDELYDPDADASGHSYQREGGFVRDADRFDAAFFGISPREALAMDPSSGCSWRSPGRPWNARASILATARQPDGVFVGAIAQDYGPRLHQAPPELEGHLLTGNTASVASGRIAYALGLTGPAVTVDTACSSSLVALHLACQSLQRGSAPSRWRAGPPCLVAGPVRGVQPPAGAVPDGRSKAFSAAADGFGLAEGVGLVVVERLSDARRHGHPVLAVVRGSAVNQDGASNGLTAPADRRSAP
ncbi:beta-ketoacyl synthase N-terminal-like domain-containing protein [Streptomyces sp. M19]